MRYFRSLAVAAAAVIVGLSSVPAFAIGTAANTTVTNNVSLNYQVNGFAQTPQNGERRIRRGPRHRKLGCGTRRNSHARDAGPEFGRRDRVSGT